MGEGGRKGEEGSEGEREGGRGRKRKGEREGGREMKDRREGSISFHMAVHIHILYPVPCRHHYTAGPDEGLEIVRTGRVLLSVAMETTTKHRTVHQSIFCEPPIQYIEE